MPGFMTPRRHSPVNQASGIANRADQARLLSWLQLTGMPMSPRSLA